MSDEKDNKINDDELDGLVIELKEKDGTPVKDIKGSIKKYETLLKIGLPSHNYSITKINKPAIGGKGYEYVITEFGGTSVVIRREKPFTEIEKGVLHELEKEIKKPEIFKNPKAFADITSRVFLATGLGDKHFVGFTQERGTNEAKWQNKGLTALVPEKDLPLLDPMGHRNGGQSSLIPTPPKVAVSQEKNIDTLLVLLDKQNRKRESTGQDKIGDLEFSLSEYANIRKGTSKLRLARGGKFIDELKRDLISGGITSYIIEKPKSYLVGSFYGIEVPKPKSKGKWKVFFNEPYKTYILESKQYCPILLQAIQDKKSDRTGYLYFFFKAVISYGGEWKNGRKPLLKVITLLDKIKSSDYTKDRPQEAFKVLCECIYYTATNYKMSEDGEKPFKEVRFFESGKCKKVKVITDLERFREWDYNAFTAEVLTELGLTDIRDALISFNTEPSDATEAEPEATEQTGEDATTL